MLLLCVQVPMLALSMAVQRVANVSRSEMQAALEQQRSQRIKAEEALADKVKEVEQLQATLKVKCRHSLELTACRYHISCFCCARYLCCSFRMRGVHLVQTASVVQKHGLTTGAHDVAIAAAEE